MPYSHDPFIEREKEKYGSPIPSREYILDYLQHVKVPVSLKALISSFQLDDPDLQEALHRRLRAMERDGQLVFTRKKHYALADKLDLLKGTVIGHRDGYGFLRVEGINDDFYLSSAEMHKVINGDVVLAQPLTQNFKGKREARIVRLLQANSSRIVGRYFTESGVGFVVPDDNRLNFDILISSQDNMIVPVGAVVVVELTQRPSYRIKALGTIVEVLGENMGPALAVDIAIRRHDIPYVWPPEVEKSLSAWQKDVPEQAKQGRVDLRALPLITIDGEDARDFDDAVYCEPKKGGGWRLWVAIADVSYYVRPQMALDNEAYQRGTSVYFPSRVVPMLPEALSNGLCSLNPNVDRLCLVCEMTVSAKGKLTSYKFYDAVMNSHARMTYTKVHHILQGDETLRQRYQAILTPIEHLHALYVVLSQAREQRGAIHFESEEPLFIFNADQRIERIEVRERNEAHKIIEECMIMANVAAAKFIEKAGQPALFRVHDKPKSENLMTVRGVLNELGLSLGGGNTPEPKDYAQVMTLIADRPDKEMLQTMLLRSMKQAIYDADNRGHFGLALSSYAHFTSPIRRYPDLLVHRVIKYLLSYAGSAKPIHTMTDSGGCSYSLDEMMMFGQHCSMTERRADEATRDVSDWLKCDFMADHIGEVFDGVIASVTGFGFFVRLDQLFIDGLVHVASLENDYYRFDLDRQRLVGESSGMSYYVGDKVKVKVESVHLDERKIDLTLISAQRTAKRVGKTRKTKEKSGFNEKKTDKIGKKQRAKATAVSEEKPKKARKSQQQKPSKLGIKRQNRQKA